MSVPRTPSRPCTGLLRAVILALVGVSLLVACGSSGSGGAPGEMLLSYERIYPERPVEQQTIFADGRVEMKHGESLERITITPQDVERIQAALKAEIPVGSPDDSPKRTLTLADGTVIRSPRPEPGTVTELLEQLLDTHRLA